jgi:acetyl coenzyme A synthetase (ADP forming)-like protein
MPNLDKFFNPESIAVIGASRSPEKIGYTILENLKVTFQGKLYPINPNTTEILGLTAYSSVEEVEEKIDLAVIAVPQKIVKSVVEECIKMKIKAAIIISSGYSEVGNKEAEEELKKLAKGKIRIIGPNCIGIYQKGLDTLFLPRKKLKRPPEGQISFITQSGAFGSALMDLIAEEGVGLSKFISLGNAIDVDETELLDYLEKDMNTRCITIYVESIEKGKEFLETAKKVVKKKPIVIYKAGKTAKGAEAVASHTGSMAGEAEIYSAAFRQAGVIEAKTTEDIFDYSKSLATQPLLDSENIAVVTDGGGFGIIASDVATELGLQLPEPSKTSMRQVKSALPEYGVFKNPIDLTGDATVERYEKIINAVLKDNIYGGLVAIILMQIPTLDETVLEVIREAKIQGKPMVVCATGGQWVTDRARRLEAFGIPVYPTPERAVKSMAVLREYAEILKRK